MKKIDKAIEMKMMETGAMGTEHITVRVKLTNSEKNEFLNSKKYDSKNYSWELEGNDLIVSYIEDVDF